jgi:hypothetical protein
MIDDDWPDLGLCCTCGTAKATTIVMLNRRGPEPSVGWGCVVCDLPRDGAVAVVCKQCVGKPLASVCAGYPEENRRVPIDQISSEPFDHDPSKHIEDMA